MVWTDEANMYLLGCHIHHMKITSKFDFEQTRQKLHNKCEHIRAANVTTRGIKAQRDKLSKELPQLISRFQNALQQQDLGAIESPKLNNVQITLMNDYLYELFAPDVPPKVVRMEGVISDEEGVSLMPGKTAIVTTRSKPQPSSKRGRNLSDVSARLSYHNKRTQTIYDDLMRTIYIDRQPNDLPGYVQPVSAQRFWERSRNRLSEIFEQKTLPIHAVDIQRVPQSLVAFLVKLFGNTKTIPIHERGGAIRSLDDELLPSVLQAYVTNMLCERIFLANDWHNDPLGESCSGMLGKTRELLAMGTGGIEILQRLDAMAFKSLLTERDKHFQKSIVPQKAASLAEEVSGDLKPFFPDSNLGSNSLEGRRAALEESAEYLLQLKLELLLAPNHYEIAWIPANTQFEAGAREGELRAAVIPDDSKVRVCICPGLMQYDPTPASAVHLSEYASTLICNRSFFPDFDVERSHLITVAKAVVLLM